MSAQPYNAWDGARPPANYSGSAFGRPHVRIQSAEGFDRWPGWLRAAIVTVSAALTWIVLIASAAALVFGALFLLRVL